MMIKRSDGAFVGDIKADKMHVSGWVTELREATKNWSNGATMRAINEELKLAKTPEKRIELLIFKTEILEFMGYGHIEGS